jgi:hypothetical protein
VILDSMAGLRGFEPPDGVLSISLKSLPKRREGR